MLNFKKQLSPLEDMYKNPVVLHHAQAEYNMSDNSSYMYPGARSHFGDLTINSNWSVATIPLTVSFDNQTWNDVTHHNFSNFSFHFDREQYLDQLKKKLKGKFNPEQLLDPALNNPAEVLKQKAGALLESELENINQQFGNGLKEQLQQVGGLPELFTKDIQSLRQQLLNQDFVKSVAEKEKLLEQLVNRKNTGQPVNQEELTRIEAEVNKMKGVQALLGKIEEHKNKWQSSGLITQLKKMDLLKKQRLEKLMKDPATTIQLAKQQLNLNGLQKLFLKINQLNIGQNTLSESRLSMQHLLNKGINTEFLSKKSSFMLGTGKMNSFNSLLNQPFANNLTAADGMMKMVRLGFGNPAGGHTNISVMSYDQTFAPLTGFSAANSFRNTVVTTVSNQVTVGEKGMLTAEISRSATTYRNITMSDSSLEQKPSLQRLLSSDDFFRNMAFSLKYEDELGKDGLQYSLHFNKTANGYTNPGSAFLNAGGKEMGFSVRKSFLKRKLQASVRSEMREYQYGEEAPGVWRNFYTVIDARWRLRKGQSVGIRYMPNTMSRVEGGRKSVVTRLERLSADAAVSKRIAGMYYRNNVTLSWQKNNYALDNQMILNESFTVASFQSITVNKKLIFLNLNYDHASNGSQYVYFNSSLMTEAGTTYLLFKKISLSSSVSYNSVKDWYRQLGIKQTVSGRLNDRFNLNIYVDARKNLALLQPLLYGLFRADVSIQYLIRR